MKSTLFYDIIQQRDISAVSDEFSGMDKFEQSFKLNIAENAPSLHQQLVAGLSAEFAKLPAGTRLPSTHELKKRFNVAYMTVTRALDELVLRGDIVRFQGKGTFAAIKSPAVIYYLIHCPLELKVEQSSTLNSAIEQAELSGGKIRLVPMTKNDVQGDVDWQSVKTIPDEALVLLDNINNYRYILDFLIDKKCRVALINTRPEYYLDWKLQLSKISNIYPQRKECIFKAVELLAKRGRKNLFLIHEGPSWNNPVRSAFREALQKFDLKFDLNNELFTTAKPGQCRTRLMTMQHLLEQIDGVICIHPNQALETFNVLKSCSRNVPGDVSIVCLNDSPLLAAHTVGISAFDLNLSVCSQEAVKIYRFHIPRTQFNIT